jgi:transposase
MVPEAPKGRSVDPRKEELMSHLELTAGIDLGDRHSHLCLLGTESGEVIEQSRISTDPKAFEKRFQGCQQMRVAIEAGAHSPWVSRLLEEYGRRY